MNDLISRKEALSLLTNLQLNGGDLADAKRFVAVMPTAYDIDKVVEQLKECRDKCVFDAEVHAYQTAVRIVKGGVTDET